MSWTFEITAGEWYAPSGNYVGSGYAGKGVGKDNVADEPIADVGPIPEGEWAIGEAYTDPESGPLTMRLTPLPDTNTYGRSGFKIHGDSINHPGEASLGCAIADHDTRLAISMSEDRVLSVIAVQIQ